MVVRFRLIYFLPIILANLMLLACSSKSDPEVTDPSLDHVFEEVDLGLSVKWAACNVGASKPSDYGFYFAWGECTDKFDFSWSNYLYADGTDKSLTKYSSNINFGVDDDLLSLQIEDDAANVNMGDTWRMPTDAEWDELLNLCICLWTEVDSVEGYLFMSTNPDYKDATLFIPAGGYSDDCFIYTKGDSGYYWSASLVDSNPSCAYGIILNDKVQEWEQAPRYRGYNVRAVRDR